MTSKILVIEDDPDQLRPITQMLKYRHYEVLAAQNGIDGVAKALSHRPELAIVDLLLVQRGDEMDGYDVIRALRNAPETASIGIIALTSHFLEGNHEILALRAGADDFIRKDVDFGLLEARIEALLRRVARSQP